MWMKFRNTHVPLHQGQILIGRGMSCSIVIAGNRISREHARVVVRGAKLTIEDLGSSNGTLVNGIRISDVQQLAAGDRIEIGDEVLEIINAPVDPRKGTRTVGG